LEGVVAERQGGTSGGSRVKTLSLKDFRRLIMYAAMQGKQRAIALNDALLEMSLLDFFCNAFGDRLLTKEREVRNILQSLCRDD